MKRTYKRINGRPLNICLVSREYPQETGWGGIGTYTHQLAHGLARNGHNVRVIALSLDGNNEYMDGNVYVHRISHRILFLKKGPLLEFAVRLEYSYQLYKNLKALIDRYDIDIVEAPNFFAEGIVYSLFKRVPLVTRLHSPFSEVINAYGWKNTFDRRLSCFLEDVSIMHSDLITCSTKACAKNMAQHLGINFKKIRIIPLGVKVPEPGNYKTTSNFPSNGRLNVLFIGRLERRKGVHILMQAIPLVLKEFPQAHFTLIGRDTFLNSRYSSFDGPKENSFKGSLLNDFPQGYRDKVDFLGFVKSEELPKYLGSCDLFVAPSLYETFGFIYIEAMSYERPVVASRIGSVSEVVIDGKNGLLVTPGDPSALAEAIAYLLRNRSIREEMGRAGREYVEKNFTQEIMVENTLMAYREVLNRKGRA
jgi:hypothetical protein